MAIETILKEFGLSDKAVKIYLSLLQSGPVSVRKLAEISGINRGTTYDILRELQSQRLVSFYHREKKQYFVAEDPEKISWLVEHQKKEYDKKCRKIIDIIPELKSIYQKAGKPVVSLYEGDSGIRAILEDVLATAEDYAVYSADAIRPYLYKHYPDFTDDRIKQNVKVKVIAIGRGGKERGLDERKWLKSSSNDATYTIIYGDKVALISVDSLKQPIGIIIKDPGITATQRLIFESLWKLI